MAWMRPGSGAASLICSATPTPRVRACRPLESGRPAWCAASACAVARERSLRPRPGSSLARSGLSGLPAGWGCAGCVLVLGHSGGEAGGGWLPNSASSFRARHATDLRGCPGSDAAVRACEVTTFTRQVQAVRDPAMPPEPNVPRVRRQHACPAHTARSLPIAAAGRTALCRAVDGQLASRGSA